MSDWHPFPGVTVFRLRQAKLTKNSHAKPGGEDWRISLAPDPLQQLIVLAVVWLFGGGTLYVLSAVEGELSTFWYFIVLPFPLIVSFYALRGLSGTNGRMELRPDGFWRTTPQGQNLFISWDRVESFGIGIFGDPVITGTGVAVPEFAYRDDTGNRMVDNLPANLPMSAEKLVMIMEYAQLEAAKDWPHPPVNLQDLIKAAHSDFEGRAPTDERSG